MRRFYSVTALFLCVAMLFACNNDPAPTEPSTDPVGSSQPAGQMDYSVTVTDPAGGPFTDGVIVTFVSESGEKTMQAANGQGVAQKTLPKGNYTVELGFLDADADYYYDIADLVLTPDNADARVILSSKVSVRENVTTTYDPVTGQETTVTEQLYSANAGYTYIPLTAGERTYVYFTPTQSGVYQFEIIDEDAVLGYYGSPYFIQSENLAERDENGAFTINVTNSMIGTGNTGSTVLVLGIDGGGLEQCCISIQRISDPEKTIEDYPWDYYTPTVDLSTFTVSDSIEFKEFDLTADGYTLVLNEDDGFYHLNTADGPLVYAKLGVDSQYLDSIQTILETSGINCYYFDDSGELVSKVNFGDCLLEYIACMDEKTGLYPLTEDLAYIFQERGEYVGWWDSSSASYLFVDEEGRPVPGINPEIAWLFLCCYEDVAVTPGPGPEDTEPTEPSTKPTEPSHTHSYTKTTVPATCSANGYTQYTCACGHSYTSDEVAAKGHSWGQWSQVKAPTLSAEGQEQRTCGTCGTTESRAVASLLGTESTEAAVEVYYYQISETMSFDAAVKAGEYANFELYRMRNMVLTIESNDAYIIYDGTVIEAVNGVLTFQLQYASNDTYTPCSFAIGNKGKADASFKVKLSVLDGIWENPTQLQLGTFTTVTRTGDEQGYFYTFTAETAGTLTITFEEMDLGFDCQISIQDTNENTNKAKETQINGTVTMTLNAGDTVKIQIEVLDPDFEFPSAKVTVTAAFE